MKVEKISERNIENAFTLVLDVFMEYEAPDYSEQGIETFKHFIHNEKTVNALEMYGAFEKDRVVGVIATRNTGNHIALFFVETGYHRQGIGRKLFEHVIEHSTAQTITVNSSPYAVAVYKQLGFTKNSDEQLADGMRYTPMTYINQAFR